MHLPSPQFPLKVRVLQVCCSVMQCVAGVFKVLQCVSVWLVFGEPCASVAAAASVTHPQHTCNTFTPKVHVLRVCCGCVAGVLQVCCGCVVGVLQCFFSVLQCVVECCSVSQSVVVCCSVLQCVAMCRRVLQSVSDALRCVVVYCSLMQCLAVC